MKLLTDKEAALGKSIKDNKVALAKAAEDVQNKNEEKKSTQKEIRSIEAFLTEIQASCDFIESNFDLRQASRTKELAALDKAAELIKATPAFTASNKL